ncbi:hypothetical protein FXO37_27100 [Capsicum annuum]|nr:hypothetical protein FXO37_27100 [Capsicum annuum]
MLLPDMSAAGGGSGNCGGFYALQIIFFSSFFNASVGALNVAVGAGGCGASLDVAGGSDDVSRGTYLVVMVSIVGFIGNDLSTHEGVSQTIECGLLAVEVASTINGLTEAKMISVMLPDFLVVLAATVLLDSLFDLCDYPARILAGQAPEFLVVIAAMASPDSLLLELVDQEILSFIEGPNWLPVQQSLGSNPVFVLRTSVHIYNNPSTANKQNPEFASGDKLWSRMHKLNPGSALGVKLCSHGVAGFSVMREFKHKSEPQFLGNWKYLTRFLNSRQILGLLRSHVFAMEPLHKRTNSTSSSRISTTGNFYIWMGYDSTTDGYKVLKTDVDRNDGCKVSSEILSLKNDSWSKIDEHPSGRCFYAYPAVKIIVCGRSIRHFSAELKKTAFQRGSCYEEGTESQGFEDRFIVQDNFEDTIYGENKKTQRDGCVWYDGKCFPRK